MKRLFFYCQHLLGIGHLRRAATLSQALGEAGFRVTFVSGGEPVPTINVSAAHHIQLPPLRARDEAFSGLVDQAGHAVDDGWKAVRTQLLLDAFAAERPDILLIEMFPFGRRQMRFELLPLLEAARAADPKPLVACSVRDILSKPFAPKKADWVRQTAAGFFDLILVHGDPDFAGFEHSFPQICDLSDRLRYTGYVVSPLSGRGRTAEDIAGQVLVSAGGGAVGEALLWAALEARPQSTLSDRVWRLLVGHNLAPKAFAALAAAAPSGVVVERARPDFPSLLTRAALSVSQAGYNTVMEVLQAGCPAVVVPFAAGGEGEQSLRARLLAERGLLQLVEERALSGSALAGAANNAVRQVRSQFALDMDGAKRTADILSQMTRM